NLWMMPRHILGEAFGSDQQSFLANPYFTTDYVNLGPFRLIDFGLGENQVFERYAGYVLGPAKVQTIIIRSIFDPNAIVASLKAGAVDIASESVISSDGTLALRDEWQQD